MEIILYIINKSKTFLLSPELLIDFVLKVVFGSIAIFLMGGSFISLLINPYFPLEDQLDMPLIIFTYTGWYPTILLPWFINL